MEGRGELKEAMRGRRAAAAARAVSSIVLDHLQRASVPIERLDFSVERGRENGREQRERERERERHGRREESVKREKKVVVWVVTSLHFFSPSALLHSMHTLALHTAGYTKMIYL